MSQTVSTLLILGATGDLSSRLLLPAVGQLVSRESDRRVALVGAGREDWTQEHWREVLASSFGTVDASGAAVEALVSGTRYQQVDVTDPKALAALLRSCEGPVAVYFALPPAIAAKACSALSPHDLPDGTVLALEKPFGTDEASAHTLNEQLATLVPEDRIHRVDHFLGRATVMNVLGLRFANRILEPLWSAEHVDSVEIVYDEQLGLEGRASYYDGAGALIDMIQSHLLQVLAVIAMEPPSTLDAADLRDAKAVVLRATRLRGDDPTASSRRARYTRGTVEGRELPSYTDEKGVDPSRETETLAELTVEIDNRRWAGVPFTLRSGKALKERRREVVIRFKPVPHLPAGFHGTAEPSVLRLFLAPDEMALELNINGPGDPYSLERASLEATFGEGELLAYGEVISGILDDDPSLSVRGDAAEECWRIVQPALDAWHADRVPLDEYPAGSEGPEGWPKA
ncbi:MULTISPECIES: glucose-6-phosphate dehydrogenase [unclassified Rathayibacter]|uniref:glucose-6-phosphate dehydrogenase n=1 Tax=unclassified Rathayibacter TaxID=2609250 RepID=UPI00188A6D19|nr:MULTISPECIES: glucose-6-phosphate dehydrogenase [unclassified Rathayibacter]MBF4462704.1 glucose-6-phosphate dehydrogenase [Rathayibacter sp. VKM Ac-2879]MBF4504118.1 glucose-6-phosphate dehydrogenase [Rathayibacter sp. VKM Ac-2878]